MMLILWGTWMSHQSLDWLTDLVYVSVAKSNKCKKHIRIANTFQVTPLSHLFVFSVKQRYQSAYTEKKRRNMTLFFFFLSSKPFWMMRTRWNSKDESCPIFVHESAQLNFTVSPYQPPSVPGLLVCCQNFFCLWDIINDGAVLYPNFRNNGYKSRQEWG